MTVHHIQDDEPEPLRYNVKHEFEPCASCAHEREVATHRIQLRLQTAHPEWSHRWARQRANIEYQKGLRE